METAERVKSVVSKLLKSKEVKWEARRLDKWYFTASGSSNATSVNISINDDSIAMSDMIIEERGGFFDRVGSAPLEPWMIERFEEIKIEAMERFKTKKEEEANKDSLRVRERLQLLDETLLE